MLSDRSSWPQEIELIVGRTLGCESSGHDPSHAFRVRNIGVRIAAATGADSEVVAATALLHDIGHSADRLDHARRGASLAAQALSDCGFPETKIGAVVACIEQHDWRPDRAGDPPHPTQEYQAFVDADRLDALGAIGIARTFAFGGAHGRPMWNPDPEAVSKSPYGISSIHHFYEKLLQLPSDMYTEPGRCLAALRVSFIKEFLKLFYIEWESRDFEFVDGKGEPSSAIGNPPAANDGGLRLRQLGSHLGPSA
jgi:uncharacterized protein